MRFVLAALTTTVILTSTGVVAQNANPNPGVSAAPSEKARQKPVIRNVQSSFSFPVPGPLGSLEDVKTTSETARRTIYEMAASECRILTDVFKADCRVVSVTANTNANHSRREIGEAMQATGQVTYELAPRE